MPVNGLSGFGGTVPAMGAAGLLARTSGDARKDEWPYPWQYCPADGEQFYIESAIDFPTNAALTQLVAYAVPDGLKLRISHLMLTYVGIALEDGLGLVTWQLAVNQPAAVVGLTLPVMPSGYGVPYLTAITISKGSPQQGPWPIPGKLVFNARDVVSVNVITAAPFPETGGQFLTSLVGWQWPAETAS
jgi:hypothetical protein